ncbi:N-acetyltransferase ESCO2-like [Panonychus citri]|uniref:N-acetyltransferase ESCO2-like n=1 Tax=Panonychus citri TaxID=50023 RepID=UPI002306FD8B|nr:N-acetyltransferase ESCO2-like [Panonychus citri]
MTKTSNSENKKETPTKLFPIFYYKNDPGKVTKPPRTPGSGSKRKILSQKQNKSAKSQRDQYFIDAGQRDFDSVRCKTCYMLFSPGEYEDESEHSKYHDTFINSLKYTPWKQEQVIKSFPDKSKILLVKPDHPKHMLKKVDELFKIADMELGINVSLFDCVKPDMVFLLYIKNNRIVGFVVGQAIKEANVYNPSTGMINIADSVPCEIGISRIWIHPNYRRNGVGTHLIDSCRYIFKPDYPVSKDKIAFTDPTEEGQAFVFKYTGRKDILVFTVE